MPWSGLVRSRPKLHHIGDGRSDVLRAAQILGRSSSEALVDTVVVVGRECSGGGSESGPAAKEGSPPAGRCAPAAAPLQPAGRRGSQRIAASAAAPAALAPAAAPAPVRVQELDKGGRGVLSGDRMQGSRRGRHEGPRRHSLAGGRQRTWRSPSCSSSRGLTPSATEVAAAAAALTICFRPHPALQATMSASSACGSR